MSLRTPGSTEPADAPIETSRAASTSDEPKRRHGALSFLRELPVLIVLAFVLAIVLKTFAVQAFYIPSSSMEPTLDPGDRVLVNKALYSPGRFDIVVFADPQGRPGPDRGVVGGALHWLSEALGVAQPDHEDFIKRVIGLPGEEVKIRDHIVYVDDEPLTESYLTRRAQRSMEDYGPVTVPDDSLFVMGDNRGNSNDSRAGLGFVPVDRVIGGAFVTIWPPSRVGWAH